MFKVIKNCKRGVKNEKGAVGSVPFNEMNETDVTP